MSDTLVIGVGNPCRGDDAFGIEVARRLKERDPGATRIVEESGEATALMEAWRGADHVIVVDAASSGGTPGSVLRLEVQDRPLPVSLLQASTHGFGVACAVELARALRLLPSRVVVYAVEGQAFELGSGLSPELRAAVPAVVEQVLAELRAREAARSREEVCLGKEA